MAAFLLNKHRASRNSRDALSNSQEPQAAQGGFGKDHCECDQITDVQL
ncbi:hypothetical protein [Lacipirellula parvula]|uniref:Uncharacterized protein n=1 Tax=Lacipirellula parvula TaxID=2650471 RepID=A0A5K7X9D9_9BACT|nr:hypothetical protein [Lacipirellula parvula]BBO32497.1 hypothetical protein PLANPX_2109 [Lacipirellula parvula]